MIRVIGDPIEWKEITVKSRAAVTETPVTETAQHNTGGRPRKPDALSAAERQRKRRARLKVAG